jgi:hypothetical protein
LNLSGAPQALQVWRWGSPQPDPLWSEDGVIFKLTHPALDLRTERELCSYFVLNGGRHMIRSLLEEAAALTSLALFIGMVVIWAQVIATL